MAKQRKLIAVAAAAAALLTANTAAHAAVPGNTVLTGDSVVANPTLVDYARNKANLCLLGTREGVKTLSF